MQIPIDQDALRELVSKAILDSLTGDKRDELLKGAIKDLIETPKSTSTYGPKVSKLEQAFSQAVEVAANRIITDMMNNDEALVSKIKGVMVEAVEHAFEETGRAKMIEAISNAIVHGLRPKSDY
jgi:hypothetical protein